VVQERLAELAVAGAQPVRIVATARLGVEQPLLRKTCATRAT
jgi:hypothetical protein